MKKTSRISQILNNLWTVRFISTMFGIIIGLYITNHFEKNNLLKTKDSAMEQVSIELSNNTELLKEYNKVLEDNIEAFTYLLATIDQNMELVIQKDSLSDLKKNTNSIFEFSTFEPLANNQIKIRGNLDFNIESQLIVKDLSYIVWESFKQTNYMSVTKFKCLTDIETIYTLQKEVNELNVNWKNVFFQGTFMTNPRIRADFMKLWKHLIMKQKLLLKLYEFKDEVMKNWC